MVRHPAEQLCSAAAAAAGNMGSYSWVFGCLGFLASFHGPCVSMQVFPRLHIS